MKFPIPVDTRVLSNFEARMVLPVLEENRTQKKVKKTGDLMWDVILLVEVPNSYKGIVEEHQMVVRVVGPEAPQVQKHQRVRCVGLTYTFNSFVNDQKEEIRYERFHAERVEPISGSQKPAEGAAGSQKAGE